MRQINPYLKAGYEAERRARGLFYKEKFRDMRNRKAICYLEGIHHFHLIIGDKETNRYRDMTGREAKTINDAFRAQFFQQCMDNPDTTERLHHWRCEKRFIGVPEENA
jgi:hypothetical protein